MRCGHLLAALVCIAAVHTPNIAVGQELKPGNAPATVTAQPLGMTGWRSDPVTVTTPVLGMTGWRNDPVMTTTPVLGMTGWRSDPIAITASLLGMTGWRRAPDTAAPPRLVCLGGQVIRLAAGPGAARYSCACPKGRTAQAMGQNYQNTFQCIPAAVVPPPRPKIACIGGVVRNGECLCGGETAAIGGVTSGGRTTYRCETKPREVAKPATVTPRPVKPQPRIVCSGGSVRNDRCVCQPGFAPVKTSTTTFRCQRVAILPPVAKPKAVTPTRATRRPIAKPKSAASTRGAPQSRPSVPRRAVPQRVR